MFNFQLKISETGYEILWGDGLTGFMPWQNASDAQLNVLIQDLMRELDEKEEAIKSVQDKAERLMLKNHPARLTIEVSPLCSLCILNMTIKIPNFGLAAVTPPCIHLSQRLQDYKVLIQLVIFQLWCQDIYVFF